MEELGERVVLESRGFFLEGRVLFGFFTLLIVLKILVIFKV